MRDVPPTELGATAARAAIARSQLEPDQIEQVGIHADRLVLPPIPQDVIEFLDGFVVVAPVHLVGDGQLLVGMGMAQRERARVAVRGCGLQAIGAEEDQKSGDTDTTADTHRANMGTEFARSLQRHVRSRVKMCSTPVATTKSAVANIAGGRGFPRRDQHGEHSLNRDRLMRR